MPAPRTTYPRPSRAKRRGTVYVVVLGAALIVSLIGMTGLMVARLQFRRATQAQDWIEAGDLALSAIEWGIKQINANTNWRTTYTNNVEITPIAMGRGTMSYKLVDAALGLASGDGTLSNNTYDPVRLYGIGRVGNAVRVYSVLLIGDVPLDVLRTTVATSGYLNNSSASTTSGGPLSSNGLFTRGATVDGDVEAGSVTGTGTITGTLTTPAPAKTMPDKGVFEYYKRLATPLTWPGGTSWTMSAPLLSDTVNPFGSTTNPSGIYYVNVPDGNFLAIETLHTKGTLVVDCGDGATVLLTKEMFWEPKTPDLPILLIRHLTTSSTSDLITSYLGSITEGSTTYPCQLRGLVHIMGATGAASGDQEGTIGYGGTYQGTLIIDGDARVYKTSATFNWDPNLYYNSLIGYTTGPTMKIVRGSCLWEAAP